MRISDGLSVIHINSYRSDRVSSERFYVWPVYGEGKVEKIHGVTRRTDSNAVYSKPLPEEHNRLIGLAKNTIEPEYMRDGRIQSRSPIPEHGTFFDAIV